MNPVWCVAWLSADRRTKVWCATYRGRRPDPDALHDRTKCGMTVTLRVGSERRRPTCPDCLAPTKKHKAMKRPRGTCPVCKRNISVRVPRGGDGSLMVAGFHHGPTSFDARRCPGVGHGV